jgi:MOSC domain-containing protein YiiM
MKGKLLSIQIGQPQEYTDKQGAWKTAFFKEPVVGSIYLEKLNLEGDAVYNTKYHGGPDQAILIYSADHYPTWRSELGQELPFGGFAENLTVSGLDEHQVCIQDIYQIGEVQIQVSKPRIPCGKISRRWDIPDLTKRVSQTNRTGWYCRVLKEGEIEAGLSIDLLERPNPGRTVAKTYQEYISND